MYNLVRNYPKEYKDGNKSNLEFRISRSSLGQNGEM